MESVTDDLHVLPVEHEILALTARLDPDRVRRQKLHDLLTQVRDGDRLVQLAIQEGLAGLLYRNLFVFEVLYLLAEAQVGELHQIYLKTARENLKRIRDLKALLQELEPRGIPVVLLKGMALMDNVYRDVGLRDMSDIDLWILKQDLPACTDILQRTGYARDHLYPNTFRRGSTTVDLHTHFLGTDRIRSRASILNKEADYIFERTRISHLEGTEVRLLDRHDQVIFLCLHLLKHNVEKLIWLVDILGIVSELDPAGWSGLFKNAVDLGQERSLACICFLLRNLLLFEITPEAASRVEEIGISAFRRKVLERRATRGALPVWAPLIFFSPGKGFTTRSIFTLETLFPGPEIMRQVLPSFHRLPGWQLYLLRIVQLVYWAISSMVPHKKPARPSRSQGYHGGH